MTKKINKVLIANRGEIAVRIIRSAKEMGIKTVAVYSEEDENAPHRFEADESYCIGPAESQKSYLVTENLLDAARKSKADAIHPGYGFLSENAKFASAVKQEKLIFVGPQPDVIEKMGDKVGARETVEKAKVPTVPGTGGLHSVGEAVVAVEKLLKERKDFKYPLLIKAAGGGGGKGMRIVRKPDELKDGIERARSESQKAFNNPMIFVERFLEKPRHIEVQVLGDGKNVIHLFERECSLQRRHQKVIEEALSPSISAELRAKLLDAGKRAAEAVNYESAGTIEFIVSQEGDFYFLEMNTRIQVEHPVTEAITGVDLVREQLRIAAGEKLSYTQDQIRANGHAIEARLYAEDAEEGFLPSPGKLHFLRFPHWNGVRVDSGVRSPSKVSSFYDPMIAKISAWGTTRDSATEKLKLFLRATEIEGLITNKSFLLEILEAEYFKDASYHTQILEEKGWRRKSEKPDPKVLAAFCLKDYLDRRLSPQSRSLSSWQEAYYAMAPQD